MTSIAKNNSFIPYFLPFIKALLLSFDVELGSRWVILTERKMHLSRVSEFLFLKKLRIRTNMNLRVKAFYKFEVAVNMEYLVVF